VTATTGALDLDQQAPSARAALLDGLRWAPLAVILTMQVVLSVRFLKGAPIPSGDEGRYIYAGHQLIYEFWHGGGSPYYETYFSGAPVIYPVLAAAADHIGGLAAVRLMSLVFMQTATCLLFGMTRRWFGYWPAVLAAGLFAGIGLTADLGALATYDAMALMLMAAAAYCASRTGERERHATRWLIAVPLVIVAANATKYASILFDPVIIGIAALQISRQGIRRIGSRLAALGLTAGLLLILALFLGGAAYLNGVMSSTLSRDTAVAAFGGQLASSTALVRMSWDWVGPPLAIAALVACMALLTRKSRRLIALLGLLLVAGLLVTAEAIHLGSYQSMYKHDDFGVWFTCAAAGCLVNFFRRRFLQIAVTLALVVGCGVASFPTAVEEYQADDGPAALQQFAALNPYLELKNASFLLGGLSDEQMIYIDGISVPWWRVIEDTYIKYPIPGRGGDWHGQAQGPVCFSLRPGCMYLEGVAGYQAAIRGHRFAVISMLGGHGSSWDTAIEKAASSTPGYEQLLAFPGPPTWVYAPDYPALTRSLTG
jgi:hypothetical protein